LGGRRYAALPYVSFNDFRIGEMAADHLHRCGIRDCMAIIDNYDVGRERLHGFQTGLARAGIELPADRVFFTNGPTLSDEELETLLQQPTLPAGIFAHGDSYLVQLYHVLLKAGRLDELSRLTMVGVGNRY